MKKFTHVVVFLLLIVSFCGCASIQSALNVSAAGSTPTEVLVATPSPTPETGVITEEMKQIIFALLELNYKEYSDEELEQLKQSIAAIKGSLSPEEIERLTQTSVQARIDVLTEEELDQLIIEFTQIDEEKLAEIKIDFAAYKDAETAKESAELKAEINQNIYDFLNYEGEFTEEEVLEKILMGNATNFEGAEKLGILQNAGDACLVQGISLGCFSCNGDIISLIGFNDKDGGRFVTPMITPTSFYEEASCPQTFSIDRYFDRSSSYGYSTMNSVENIEGLLNKIVANRAIVVNLLMHDFTDDYNESMDGWPDFIKNYVTDLKEKSVINKKLASELFLYKRVHVTNFDIEEIPEDIRIIRIIKVENPNDYFEVNLDDIPMLESLGY